MMCYSTARRSLGGSATGLHIGALTVVAIITLAVAATAPGLSYLFTWPLLAAALVAVVRAQPLPSLAYWAATLGVAFVTTAFLVPIAYAVGAVMLGVTSTGGIVAAVLTTLIAWLLAPLMETLSRDRPWSAPIAVATAALILFVVGATTVRRSDRHPVPSAVAYVVAANTPDAWLTSANFISESNPWTREIVGRSSEVPDWVRRAAPAGSRTVGRRVARLSVAAPAAEILSDSSVGNRRLISLRVRPGRSAIAVNLRLVGAPALSASIDGLLMDTTRFRRPSRDWALQYWAPPDSGFTITLTVPGGSTPELELRARSDGIPALPGITIPPRPDDVVPVQLGDVTVVYRRVKLSPSRP
jgi:hypothetical protein